MQKNIRQAKTEDAFIVAPLIVQAMGDLACDFTGKEAIEQAIPLFETLLQKQKINTVMIIPWFLRRKE